MDLGAGSGALVVRIQQLGMDALGVEIEAGRFQANAPVVSVNLDEPEFAAKLGEQAFDLVTSVEVIEHLESPLGFLRNVRRLLKPEGVAVLTTPNVENTPARLKFLLTGRLRLMDGWSDPTHISPIFWDLLTRQLLPRARLELVEHSVYPPDGYKATRARYAWAMRLLAPVLSGAALQGDNHIVVLRVAGNKT